MHTSVQQRGATVFSLRKSIQSMPDIHGSLARALHLGHLQPILLLSLVFPTVAAAQIDTTSYVPHRYLVLYRNATIPGDAEAHIRSAGARLTQRNEHLGIAVVQSPASQQDDAATLRLLAAQPNVVTVLHDRIVSAHQLRAKFIASTTEVSTGAQTANPSSPIGRLPTHG